MVPPTRDPCGNGRSARRLRGWLDPFPRREVAMTDTNPDNTTTFEDVNIDEDLSQDGQAPVGNTLTEDEETATDHLIEEIEIANAGRGPAEKVSIDPAE